MFALFDDRLVPLLQRFDRVTQILGLALLRSDSLFVFGPFPVKLSFPLVVCTLPSFVLLAIVPAALGAISTLRASAP